MQQENNIPSNMGVSEVQPTTSASDNGVAFSDKPKKNKGMMLGMILLAIFAVGGIGFGVWAMLDGNARVDNLDKQISSLKTQNSELMEKLDETPVESEDVTLDIDTEVSVDTANYIYVGEWGLKVKVPDTLEVVTYTYDYGDSYTMLGVSGATKDGQSIPDFAKIGNCMLGAVDRFSKTNVEMGVVPDYYGDPFMSDDEYSYYYSEPQAVCTEDQNSQQWEVSTVDIIKNMLSNSDNYSNI